MEGVRGRRALFAVVPDETHTFGARLAAETFREAGWSIDLKVGIDHEGLVDHVQRTEPNIIGLSLSTEAGLPNLVRLVVALRLVRPQAIIGVAPALSMEDSAIQAVTDTDIIFRDARQAVRDLDWMLQLRS
jgi:methanogenic corrinoid protein MtbC1